MGDDRGRRVIRPVPRPDAGRTLICFSFAGGGTFPFRAWAQDLPGDVELAVYCYPGREFRFSTPFATGWDGLLDDALDALAPLTAGAAAGGRDYVLFGHSFGALVAYDATVRLAAAGMPGPQALVVSASPAPPDRAADESRTPAPEEPDEVFVTWLRRVSQLPEAVYAEPELLGIAIDTVRADLRVGRGYRYDGSTVDVPVQVFYGAQDPLADRDDAKGWEAVAAGRCRIDELPGAHFYTGEVWAGLGRAAAAA